MTDCYSAELEIDLNPVFIVKTALTELRNIF